MRRTATNGPLSPQLVKHFAAATAALTGLLALFATGEDWGARAQIDAVDARNQLIATEAEKLGSRRVAASLKIEPGALAGDFNSDPGPDHSGGFSSSGSAAPRRLPSTPREPAPAPPPFTRSESNPAASQPPHAPPLPGTTTAQQQGAAAANSAPTAQQIARLKSGSARRSARLPAAED